MSENLYIQLIWEEPITGELNQPLLIPPIAIGREKKEIPEKLGSYPVSQVELIHKQVSRFHALITVANNQMYITDKSSNGTYINGRQIPKGSQPFASKDTIRIGPYKITAILVNQTSVNNTDSPRRRNGNMLVEPFPVPPLLKGGLGGDQRLSTSEQQLALI